MIQYRRLAELSNEERGRVLKRAEVDISGALGLAAEMIEQIRLRGDAAVLDYVRKLDYAEATLDDLKVSEAEFSAAEASLSAEVKAAVEQAHRNIRRFHEEQMPEPMWLTEIEPGVMAGEKTTSIESVALYVPRGKGSFPSVMLMLAVPATVAGVEKIIVCTPPNPDGSVDAASLYAARLCGLSEIYKLGGIQAIAAVALGTERVPKVAKVIGPGNSYVSAAKRLLFGTIDVGTPAGPSESIILADENADPRIAALDLLIEAEHGADSAATLVTHSAELAEKVRDLLPDYIAQLPEWRRNFIEKVLSSYGGILLTESLADSIHFVNAYAPEHLEVLVDEPFSVLGSLKHAGEILLGPYAPISIGNYCLGLNAILPTGGFARSYSSVSVSDFIKKSGVGYLSKAGYQRLSETTRILADYEDFPAHALAIRERDKLWFGE